MRSVGSVCGMQMDMHEVTDIVSEMLLRQQWRSIAWLYGRQGTDRQKSGGGQMLVKIDKIHQMEIVRVDRQTQIWKVRVERPFNEELFSDRSLKMLNWVEDECLNFRPVPLKNLAW